MLLGALLVADSLLNTDIKLYKFGRGYKIFQKNPNFSIIFHKIQLLVSCLYTRYPIVARRAWPLGRVRRASKGILHTSLLYNVQLHV